MVAHLFLDDFLLANLWYPQIGVFLALGLADGGALVLGRLLARESLISTNWRISCTGPSWWWRTCSWTTSCSRISDIHKSQCTARSGHSRGRMLCSGVTSARRSERLRAPSAVALSALLCILTLERFELRQLVGVAQRCSESLSLCVYDLLRILHQVLLFRCISRSTCCQAPWRR